MSKQVFRTKQELLARMALRQGVTQTIDLTVQAPPDRVYAARECFAEMTRGMVEVGFAQYQRGSEKLRSMVVITMAPVNVLTWLHGLKKLSGPSLQDISQQLDLKPEQISSINSEATQVVEMTAQVASVAISGQETALDFYKIGPHAMHKHKGNLQDVKLDPQVRVELRTTLFMGLIERLRVLSAAFPSHAALELEKE